MLQRSRNFTDQAGYGSTPEDERFALIAALLGGAWLFGAGTLFHFMGWL